MSKIRIIPCLDVKGGRTVKGVNFVDLVDAGDPVEQARLYNDAGADELCLLDIGASQENRGAMLDVLGRAAKDCSIPLIVGGGISMLNDIHALLLAGADRVSIGSAALREPDFIAHAAEAFGTRRIIVAIDAKRIGGEHETSEVRGDAGAHYEIFTQGGREPTGIDAVDFARTMEARGAGEILLTSVDRDGTRKGYDLGLTRAVAEAVGIPVIASGGVGTLDHLVEGVIEGKASAVLAASIFHFGEYSIAEAKAHMAAAGIGAET